MKKPSAYLTLLFDDVGWIIKQSLGGKGDILKYV